MLLQLEIGYVAKILLVVWVEFSVRVISLWFQEIYLKICFYPFVFLSWKPSKRINLFQQVDGVLSVYND